jgi:hypothetical protein
LADGEIFPSGKETLYPLHQWKFGYPHGCAVAIAQHDGYEVEVVCLDCTSDVAMLRLQQKVLAGKGTDPKKLLATCIAMDSEDMVPKWKTIDERFWRDVDPKSLAGLKDAISGKCITTRFARSIWSRSGVITPLIHVASSDS